VKIKSYAKVNIFLKIVGTKENYHLINSRFMLVKNLYDTLTFEKKDKSDKNFVIEGSFSCETKQNIIYKIYEKLLEIDELREDLIDFFTHHKVCVKKNIPEFAGLGGGSSNAAAFLKLINQTLSLKLSTNDMVNLSKTLGADIAFFLHDFESAEVLGIGEKVKRFDESALDIKTLTPPIKCETPLVYKKYREILNRNYDKITKDNRLLGKKLQKMSSEDILKNFDIYELNDLYSAALKIYPKLREYQKENYFFSGSGSTFFKRIS